MRGGGHGPVSEKAFNFNDLKAANSLLLNTYVNTFLLAFFEALTRCSHPAFIAFRQALSSFKIFPLIDEKVEGGSCQFKGNSASRFRVR